MTKLFNTQQEYRIWITSSIILFSLIGKDFTLLLASFWIGWTVSRVEEGRIDIIFKQIGVILVATLIGLMIGYKFSFIRLLEVLGWI